MKKKIEIFFLEKIRQENGKKSDGNFIGFIFNYLYFYI